MYDVFMGIKKPEDILVNVYDNIDLLPANTDMNFLEFDKMKDYEENMYESTYTMIQRLINRKLDLRDLTLDTWKKLAPMENSITYNYYNLLDGKFDKLDEMYDVILFDTPPEIKSVTSSIISICDVVLIPYEPDWYSFDGIINILERIQFLKDEYNPDLEIAGLLPVKVKANTKVHADMMVKVMKYANSAGIPFFSTVIPNTIKFASATAMKGLPATLDVKLKANEKLVYAYFELLEEMESKGILTLGDE